MSLVSNENKVVIGFKSIVVILLAAIAFLSIPAFANGYPHFGWLCISVVGAGITLWILLAGKSNLVVVIILCIFAVVGIIAYVTGVPSEWHKLTEQEAVKIQTQAIVSITPHYSLFSAPDFHNHRWSFNYRLTFI